MTVNKNLPFLAITLILLALMAGFAQATPVVVMGQTKALPVQLTNTRGVTETLDLYVENSEEGTMVAEPEQKVLSLRAGETKTVNVLVKPYEGMPEGAYSVKLIGKKIVTLEQAPAPAARQPLPQPYAGQPYAGQPYAPAPQAYPQSYGQSAYGAAPYGGPNSLFRPLAGREAPLLPDTGDLDLDGALSVEFTLTNRNVDKNSVTFAVRNELFNGQSSKLIVNTAGNGVFVDFLDDIFEKREIIPMTLALKDRTGNNYTVSGTVSPSGLAVQDLRMAIGVRELENIDARSLRIEVRGNNFGGTFLGDGPGVSFNPYTGQVIVDVPGAPLRLGERVHFTLSGEDESNSKVSLSGAFVFDLDDRLPFNTATPTGDTLKDFVDAVDSQKYRDYMAYRRAVIDPYINIRNELDRQQRIQDIDYASYYGVGPVYTDAPAGAPSAGAAQAMPTGTVAYFDGGQEYDALPQDAWATQTPAWSQTMPRETVREEVVFAINVPFRVVKAASSPAVTAAVTRPAQTAPARSEAKPLAAPVTVKVNATPEAQPIEAAAAGAVSGLVSFGNNIAGQTLFIVLVALIIVAFLARPAKATATAARRVSVRGRPQGSHSAAMHVILNYKK